MLCLPSMIRTATKSPDVEGERCGADAGAAGVAAERVPPPDRPVRDGAEGQADLSVGREDLKMRRSTGSGRRPCSGAPRD